MANLDSQREPEGPGPENQPIRPPRSRGVTAPDGEAASLGTLALGPGGITDDGLPQSPLYSQYRWLRQQVPGALLLFRLGDFYELFGEDAKFAAPRLALMLTSRDGDTPMCGVPAMALEETLAKLVATGRRVAVAEQMELPRPGVKLVRREIVRMASPGTYVEPEGLSGPAATPGADANGEPPPVRRVAVVAGSPRTSWDDGVAGVDDGDRDRGDGPDAAAAQAGACGVAICDLVTGAFAALTYTGRDARARAVRTVRALTPSEVLWDPALDPLPRPCGDTFPIAPDWVGLWEPAGQEDAPGGPFDPKARDVPAPGLGRAGLRAATALYRYVRDMAGEAVQTLTPLAPLPADGQGWGTVERQRVAMDDATRRQLELTRSLSGRPSPSLLATVDRTRTPMGARLLKAWLEAPLVEVGEILTRQASVALLVAETAHRADLRTALAPMADVDRLTVRAATDAVTPRELGRLAVSLAQARDVAAVLENLPPGPLRAFLPDLTVPDALDRRIFSLLADDLPLSPRDGGLIRDGADPEVDRLRALLTGGRDSLSDIEAREREVTGLPWRLGYHRKLGYFLEIARSRQGTGDLPERFRLVQGMAAATRYTTPELTSRSQELSEAQERLAEVEYERFVELRSAAKGCIDRLRALARATGEVDVRQALAETAQREGWVRPEIVPGVGLSLRGSKHPVVEAALPPGTFVPNDAELGTTCDLYVVTGPNMGGKSTYLRQVALCAILAQVGSFVPADRARAAPVDRIFARIGAGDDLAGGRSTFLVEMAETAAILRSATRRSLVVIDELGRGTATFDGLALAWAIIEHLATRVHALTLVATHYHELIELAQRLDRAGNLSVQAVEAGGEVRFLRRVVPGGADRSYGIAVARLAGIPAPVLKRAEELLLDLETGTGPTVHGAKGAAPAQMQLLPDPDAKLARELLALDLGRTSPIDALVFLTALQERLRREGRAT